MSFTLNDTRLSLDQPLKNSIRNPQIFSVYTKSGEDHVIVIGFTYLHPIPFYGDQRDGMLLILGHKSCPAKIRMNISGSKQGFTLHPKENDQMTYLPERTGSARNL
jgi:hypothetical protein